MSIVGIRQMKAQLSRFLKKVKRGESIIITEHGKQIAQIIPMATNPERDRLLELARKGVIKWSGKKPVFPMPTIKLKGKPLSQMIIEDREDRV